MPNKDLINILGEPENKVEDLKSVLGEPELKKKAVSSSIPTDISSSELGVPSSQEPKPFVESTGFVPQSTLKQNRDLSNKYNTPLSESDKKSFNELSKKYPQLKNDIPDYDVQGWYLKNKDKAEDILSNKQSNPDLHYGTDEFKKPSHPTFSDESKYHGLEGNIGGKWGEDSFTPSKTNLQNYSKEELKKYFNEAEKGVKLNIPIDNQEIKNKQSQIIQERTKQQFLTNPLFQESNPNAQKNKEIYINTLANKGFKRSDLELESKSIDRTKELAKENGVLDMSEGELSQEFWNKTIDAAKHGYQRVKEGFEETAQPLIPQEYKTSKDFVDKPLAQEPNIKPYLKTTVGLMESAMSPVIAGFDIGTKAIKEAADKTLPKPAAEVVGNAIPALFDIVGKASKALGVKVEYDVNGATFTEDRLAQRAKELNVPLEEYLQKVGAKMKETPATYLMEIGNMIVGGKFLHLAGEGGGEVMKVAGQEIKNIKDFKDVLSKAANGELSEDQLDNLKDVVDEIKNTSLSDIKKGAQNSNTPLGDVVSAKINDIEQPSTEHKISPELESLEKQKSDLESDRQKLENKIPGSGSVLDNDIANINSKLEEVHNKQGDLIAGEGLNNVIHSELDNKISELEASKEGLSESGKQSIDNQIQSLKSQKSGIPEKSPELEVDKLITPKEDVTLIHHGDDIRDNSKEVGGTEPTDLTIKGEKDILKTAENLKGVSKIYTSPIERAMQSAQKIRNKNKIPVEINNGLGAWKIGDFDGMDRNKFEKAQKWFVDNPDATKLPEKGSKESIDNNLENVDRFELKEPFGDFKNRVVSTYNTLVNKGEKDVGILTHSKNIKIIEALRKYGEWNEAAKKEFTNPENKIHSAEIIKVTASPKALKEGEIKTEQNAIKEISQPESVQGEREGGNQSEKANQTSGGNRLFGEAPSAEEKIKTIPELTDEEYVDKFVNSGLFNPVGDVYQERLDLGMPTADIQKGLRDIQSGKDSAPARKLKEAILKTKETQTVPVIRGTGGKSERFNRDLSDYSHDIENAPIKLTAEEIKSANKINPILAEAISKEGITVENIDKLIDENAGEFPYSNEDLQTIKDYLNEKRRQETTGNVEAETVTSPSESVEAITESKRATEKYNEINSIKSERIKSKAKEKFVNDNFENIVAQLMLKNKIKRKC